MSLPRFALIVPTLNPGADGERLFDALLAQADGAPILIVDSSSDDGSAERAAARGLQVHRIERRDFDHGGTRQLAAERMPAEILVYLTQDALPADGAAIGRLLAAFDDPAVGAAYGRQLPRTQAADIEAHARLFNYPAQGHVVSMADAPRMGIKTPFMSDSFAAYRRSALLAVGGFPQGVICSEDMHVGARLLQAGWRLAYVAEAAVRHSHAYSLRQDFQRYFDVGVFQARQPWIRAAFGQAGGEGLRFVRSEQRYLLRRAPWRMPEALLRTALKLLAYRLGLLEARLPLGLKTRLSLQKHYWRGEPRKASA